LQNGCLYRPCNLGNSASLRPWHRLPLLVYLGEATHYKPQKGSLPLPRRSVEIQAIISRFFLSWRFYLISNSGIIPTMVGPTFQTAVGQYEDRIYLPDD